MVLETRIFPVRTPAVARSNFKREGSRRVSKNGSKLIYMRMTGFRNYRHKRILDVAILAEKGVKYFLLLKNPFCGEAAR